MEVDDYVETSDIEELQELEDEGRRALSGSRQNIVLFHQGNVSRYV